MTLQQLLRDAEAGGEMGRDGGHHVGPMEVRTMNEQKPGAEGVAVGLLSEALMRMFIAKEELAMGPEMLAMRDRLARNLNRRWWQRPRWLWELLWP